MVHPVLISIGFGTVIMANRIVAIVAPDSLSVKGLKEKAKSQGRLIDATQGRKTRALIVADSHHVVLSAIGVQTLSQRLMTGE